MPIKYYRCSGCNLVFKDLESAIVHKSSTEHSEIRAEYFVSRYDPFPPFKLEKYPDALPELVASEDLPIGESDDPCKEFYICLTCRLTFKDRTGADEHRLGTNHKVVRGNYPIGPDLTTFRDIGEIRGLDIDYDAFFQRMIDDVPNED